MLNALAFVYISAGDGALGSSMRVVASGSADNVSARSQKGFFRSTSNRFDIVLVGILSMSITGGVVC